MNSTNTILTAILVLIAFGLGYAAGATDLFTRSSVNTTIETGNFNTTNTKDDTSATTGTSATANGSTSLSPDQRRLLESFGINPDTVNITPQMIACAEAELGSARIAEIRGGDKPSFTEGAKLMACYKQ